MNAAVSLNQEAVDAIEGLSELAEEFGNELDAIDVFVITHSKAQIVRRALQMYRLDLETKLKLRGAK